MVKCFLLLNKQTKQKQKQPPPTSLTDLALAYSGMLFLTKAQFEEGLSFNGEVGGDLQLANQIR